MIPRGVYPGYASGGNSVFTIERSEPFAEDESWERVSSAYVGGTPCAQTVNTSQVGFTEVKYLPEKYTMSGILLCRNDIPLNFNTPRFWEDYFTQLEHRGAKTSINRLVNVNAHFSSKAACVAASDWAWYDTDLSVALPLGGSTTPTPDLTALPHPDLTPYHALNADMLELGAQEMFNAGATAPDSDGWLTMGPTGVVYPLIIGNDAANLIFTQNSDLLNTMRYAYMGHDQDMNPLLRRFGATTVLKSFRYIFDAFPMRWAWNGTTAKFVRISAWVMLSSGGSASAVIYKQDGTEDTTMEGAIARQLGGTLWTDATGPVPAWKNAHSPSKGVKAVINPVWSGQNFGTDGYGYSAGSLVGAPFEAAYSPNPKVMTEEIVRPINSMRNAAWTPTNYMGEWVFVDGPEALHGVDTASDCAKRGVDPFNDYGIHYGRFWHAFQPVHPEYGRVWIFKRCSTNYSVYTCPS